MLNYECNNCDYFFPELKNNRCPNCESENCMYGYWEDDVFYAQPPDEKPLETDDWIAEHGKKAIRYER